MDTKQKKLIRNSIAGIIGNVMEWYDFAVFGFLAPIITLQFFPNDTPLVGLIKTYGIFATGYLMRPLGGLFFGYIGDKLGRKKALIISIFMMAIPTVLIGLLPTFKDIGIYAAFLMILFRIIQGLSVGGELIGSISFMSEISSHKHKGFLSSLTFGSAIGGLLLGSTVVSILTNILGDKTMDSWGWRIPFLLGIFILLIGLWLREKMTESPQFLSIQEHNTQQPLHTTLLKYKHRILHLSAIISLTTITSYILFVWVPTFLSTIVKHHIHNALTINTISMIVLLFSIPLAGYLSDIYNRKKIVIYATIVMILTIYPIFMVFQHGTYYTVLIAQILFAIIVGFLQGPIPALMSDMFPTHIRYTSMGIGYNFSVALLGGTAPAVATWLVEITGNLYAPAFYIIFFAIISLIAIIKVKEL